MDNQTSKDDYDELLRENLKLKAEIQLLKGKHQTQSFIGRMVRRVTTNVFVGKGLKRSVLRLFEEIPEGKVTKVTLADVSSHVVWRLTRVGLFTLLLGIIPLMILGIQTYILNSQNDLLKEQNRRLDQQINLEEGSRRSSLIFLMSNIMDKMGEELKNPKNRNNKLSDALIGRIVSLSQALRPYRYFEDDHLIDHPLSPERGQLLISLINSELHETTYEKIFDRADFSYADLKNATFDGNYMQGIELAYADLSYASFKNTDLEYANLEGANLSYSEFDETYMNGIELSDANLQYSHLHNVKMTYATLYNANFTKAELSGDFRNSIIDGIDLDSVRIGFLDLEGIEIRTPEIMRFVDTNDVASIFELPEASRQYLNENFVWKEHYIQKDDMSKSSLFILTRKKASNLSVMDDCLKKIVEIIKSSDEIQQMDRAIMRKKDHLNFLVEANPFGDDNLGVRKDSLYLYRMTTDESNPLSTLAWISYNPANQQLLKFTLDDTVRLHYNRRLLKEFPENCNL